MLSVFPEMSHIEKEFNFHVDNLINCLEQFSDFLECFECQKLHVMIVSSFYSKVFEV